MIKRRYAANGMEFPRWGKDSTAMSTNPRPKAIAKIGRAVLTLRLYRGWSQLDLERSAGVDQTTISRLERGIQRGLSIRKLAAILDALLVGDVIFDKRPTVPQTALEVVLYGDPWRRAIDAADRRLAWPKPAAFDDAAGAEIDRTAWFEDRG
jgi:transcriptional regulator with XRE-family HTH domain